MGGWDNPDDQLDVRGKPRDLCEDPTVQGRGPEPDLISSRSIGTGGSGSYPWAIPSTQAGGSDYQVKVTSTTNSAYTDTSNANFTITGPLPVVSVTLTDGSATEAGPTTGMYRISRDRGHGFEFECIVYDGGIAQNGVDYNAITSPMTIPPGASYVYVTLRPIDDSEHEGNETADPDGLG